MKIEHVLVDCPHCQKVIQADELPDALMLRDDNGDFSFFHEKCARERSAARKARYLKDHEERRKHESVGD